MKIAALKGTPTCSTALSPLPRNVGRLRHYLDGQTIPGRIDVYENPRLGCVSIRSQYPVPLCTTPEVVSMCTACHAGQPTPARVNGRRWTPCWIIFLSSLRVWAADMSDNAGRLRKRVEDMDITGYIPIHPSHERNMVAKGGFDYRGDHPVRPECKASWRGGFHRRDRVYQYVTR